MIKRENLYYNIAGSFYDKVDPRRAKELRDSRLIHEDQNAMANLSPRAIHKEWDADMPHLMFDPGIKMF